MKWPAINKSGKVTAGRSPYGERGLKSLRPGHVPGLTLSLPVRVAWIEITRPPARPLPGRSLPVRGAWIEITSTAWRTPCAASLPVRGAWIEIIPRKRECLPDGVAPRTGSVD